MTRVAVDRQSPRRAEWFDFVGRMLGRRSSRSAKITEVERALISAHGKALTMLATALHARGVMDMADFAGTLGVFSVVVAEDNQLEGDILAVWAGTMKESLGSRTAESDVVV